eukprot:3350715-Ditylum_brightwellii.AAC.1
MAIEATIAELVIPYKCNHVRGHQDRKKPSKKQTAQDDLATAAYNDLKQGNMRDTFDPIAYAK